MGAREDFEAVRRAAGKLESDPPGGPANPYACVRRLLAKAGAREMAFFELSKRSFFPEVIDLAYAVLGEERPGGPASESWNQMEAGR